MTDTELREPTTAYAPPTPALPAAPEALAAAADAEPRLPFDTTPTWELELLVSGAVLFGLFQVPPLVLATFARYQPHLGTTGVGVGVALTLLVLALFYTLIGCFVMHLILRAYWVALVGVQSVFPHGVRWDKQREYGPIQADLARERVRPLPPLIARADNAASMVFATGFVLAASAIVSLGFIVILGLLLTAFIALLGTERGLIAAAVVYFALIVPLGAAPIIDLKFGARIDPDGRFGRLLRGFLRVAGGPIPVGVRSMASVLTSNVDKRVAYGVAVVMGGGALALAMTHVLPSRRVLPTLGTRFFADAAPGASMPALRYDTFRGDAPASDRAPSIDADVVSGPYLRLFVPYRAPRHEEALPAVCPGLRPLSFDDQHAPAARTAAAETLRCVGLIHRVTLDGRPLDALRYRFLADPRTNRRGFVAYIPVGALAVGEHLLTVTSTGSGFGRGTQDPPYEIPFWK